jgi:hypothetical protein
MVGGPGSADESAGADGLDEPLSAVVDGSAPWLAVVVVGGTDASVLTSDSPQAASTSTSASQLVVAPLARYRRLRTGNLLIADLTGVCKSTCGDDTDAPYLTASCRA